MNDESSLAPKSEASGSALLGNGAVIVWNDVVDEGREQFYAWHDKEHIPERLGIPGFRRGRRYLARGQTPEWLTMYEADDLSVVTSPAYIARLNAPTPLTTATLKYFRNTSRAVCRLVHSLGSSTGGYMLALRVSVPSDQTDAFREYIARVAFPLAMEANGVVACHLFASDDKASFVDTAESKTRAFDVPSWVVLCEATLRDAADNARKRIDGGAFAGLQAEVRPDGGLYALEICRLSSQ